MEAELIFDENVYIYSKIYISIYWYVVININLFYFIVPKFFCAPFARERHVNVQYYAYAIHGQLHPHRRELSVLTSFVRIFRVRRLSRSPLQLLSSHPQGLARRRIAQEREGCARFTVSFERRSEKVAVHIGSVNPI